MINSKFYVLRPVMTTIQSPGGYDNMQKQKAESPASMTGYKKHKVLNPFQTNHPQTRGLPHKEAIFNHMGKLNTNS